MASQVTRWCFVVVFIASGFGFAQTVSKEEAVLRETYAKVAYSAQTSAVMDAVSDNRKIDGDTLTRKVVHQEVQFKIENVTVGKIQDIGGKSYADYVTKPETGDALHFGLTGVSAVADGKEVHQVGVRPHWEAPAAVTRGPLDWGGITVQPALSQAAPGYDRYAAATVTVSYQARSHTYKTLWLFDSSGKQPVLPIDLLTGNSLLAQFATEDVTPMVLLDTRMFSAHPAVQQWLLTHQVSAGTCKGKVCCLPTGTCGVTASAVSATIQKYPPRARLGAGTTGSNVAAIPGSSAITPQVTGVEHAADGWPGLL